MASTHSQSDRLGIGFSIHADLDFLELARALIEDEADYLEVNPETLWRPAQGARGEAPRLERNDYWQLFADMQSASGKPFVAHGLAFSLGSAARDETDTHRSSAWIERLRDDFDQFDFAWMSEHLGWTQSDGKQAVLPLPLPFTEESVRVVASRLRELAEVVPVVAFENSANYFGFGVPDESAEDCAARETDWLNAILHDADCRMLLDLHNVHTQAENAGFDPFAYVDRLDLARVVEIHVSGGSYSESDWLPSGRVMRLDSHDGPVPERVWSLLEHVLPHCHALRGIVVERLNGTFDETDIEHLTGELRRARSMLPLVGTAAARKPRTRASLAAGGGLAELQSWLVEVLAGQKPLDRLDHADEELAPEVHAELHGIDRDGFALTGLLVRKLRFERLCRGDDRIERAFDSDPAVFVEDYERYVREVPATAYFPSEEARLYAAWQRRALNP